MIHEVEGDILLSKAQAIAHGVSPNDDFHQGLALALREQWPALYKDFRHFCQVSTPTAGTLWTWAGANGQRIVNLFTQEPAGRHHGSHPGRATLAHVNHCLRDLRKLGLEEQWQSVALSRLATGVGGLDWKDVKPLIQQHLGDLDAKVIVYSTYRKGVAAAEGV